MAKGYGRLMYRKWNSLEVFYVTTILIYDIISKTKQTRICMYQFFLPSFLACTFFYACVCLLHTFSFNDLVYVFFLSSHLFSYLLFVCVSHTGDAEIKPWQGGIRYKTYLYQPCHACCCYLNKNKIGAFMKCHIHLLANISIRDMANYSLALGIVTFYPA